MSYSPIGLGERKRGEEKGVNGKSRSVVITIILLPLLLDWSTDGWMEGVRDRQTDGQTDGRKDWGTDWWTNWRTDGLADGLTEGRTDRKKIWGALGARANDITNNKSETEFWCHPRSDAIVNNLHSVSAIASSSRGWVSNSRRFCQAPRCSVVGWSSNAN